MLPIWVSLCNSSVQIIISYFRKKNNFKCHQKFYLKETYSVFSYRLLKLSASTQTKTPKTMDDPHFIKKQKILSFPFLFFLPFSSIS